MTRETLRLANPPIVEAVVDIEWDLPAKLDLSSAGNRLLAALGSPYVTVQPTFAREEEVAVPVEGRSASVQIVKSFQSFTAVQKVQSLRILTADAKQLIQVRDRGYSFNRLQPYTTLDDYLPEIERTWNICRSLATPVQLRAIRLRYINRIHLPMTERGVTLPEYLCVGPLLPDETLAFTGFLNEHSAVELATGNQARITLVTQPDDRTSLPIILDIETSDPKSRPIEDWIPIQEAILSLRSLADRIFRGTLTDKCLNLFQQP